MEDNTNSTLPQNPKPVEETPVPRKSLSLWKKILLIIFGTVCFFGIWNTILPLIFPQKQPAETTDTQSMSPSIPTNGKTYTNKKYKYSVKYPDTLAMTEETPYSTVFTINPKPVARLVFPTFYVSVIPDGFTKKDEVYNFMETDSINNFFSMQDNESLQTEAGTTAEYWTFKRLAAISVGGESAIMIQNNNVFEGEGLTNRRILIKKNGLTYIIGSYFQSQEELTSFQNFVMNFTFLQ